MPKLEIRYIPEVKPDEEGFSKLIFEHEFGNEGSYGCLTLPHRDIELPNGETLNIVSEITHYGNTFTARQNLKRLCSIKAEKGFVIMFLTKTGLELYVELSL